MTKQPDDLAVKLSALSPEQRARLKSIVDRERMHGISAGIIARAVNRDRGLPLSFAQARLWFLDRYEPNSPLYNIPCALRIRGDLNVAALAASLDAILQRHEILRTTFTTQADEPVQIIAASSELKLATIDVSHLSGISREATALKLAETDAQQPFDLRLGPLLRARLVKLAPDDYVLIINLHHIVSDGWSMGVLYRDLSTLYQAHVDNTAPILPELPIQYADYAIWQRDWLSGAVLEGQLGYWKRQLEGAPPLLKLPTDRPRPATQTYLGARQTRVLPQPLRDGLKALSRSNRVTLFMTLLAAFQVLLARYTQTEDIIVGSPIAGRTRSETENLIGFFVNTLVLRTDLSGDPGFTELLTRVRETALSAYAHQDLPFEKLVEELRPTRSLSYAPVFQVMFALQNVDDAPLINLMGLSVERIVLDRASAKFDLFIALTETAAGLELVVEYNTDLLEEAAIVRLIGHYETLLQGIIANPDQRISTLPLLTAGERHQLLVDWNQTATDYPKNRCVHQLFEEQVTRTPDAVAVVCEDNHLSYAELNARANQLAHQLIALGVGPDVLVGLCVERSIEMIVALLAILKAGGAYVPLDPGYPKQRLGFMLEDTQAPMLVTQCNLERALPEHSARCVFIDQPGGFNQYPRTNPATNVAAGNLTYVIYTSGSTGTPKGVVITHANVTRLMAATQPWFHFDHNDVWTLFHSYAFDFSVWEIWGALLYGGRLVVVPYAVSRDPAAFYELLSAERVTVLNQTPSAFRQLMHMEEHVGMKPLALRYVIFGGEALEVHSLKAWFERHGATAPQLVNMYGITETTVHVTYRPLMLADVMASSGSVIGQAIPDLQVYILDAYLQPVPVGLAGELHVGGAGLARGYLNRPELTAERFIPHPFSADPRARLYKSGDLARYLPNGDIEYVGRIDQQVKIRGFRIELGEIETVLVQHPQVREAVITVREDMPGDKRLVAYIVSAKTSCLPSPGEATPGEIAPHDLQGELRTYLRHKLPDYMRPSAFIILDKLPLTANGKVDRKALPAPDRSPAELEELFAGPRNLFEQALTGIWREVLNLPRVGIHDNFFDLGGHSLLVTQVISRIRQTYHMDFPLRRLFEAPTIAGLALAVMETRAGQIETAEMERMLAELEASENE